MVRATSPTYYGDIQNVAVEDIDFDIGDTVDITGHGKLNWFSHSHGSVEVQAYARADWRTMYDPEGNVLKNSAADRPTAMFGVGDAAGGGLPGALRLAGSGIDDTTLTYVIQYTIKTAG